MPSQFLIAAEFSVTSGDPVTTSPDALTWTRQPGTQGGNCECCAFGAGLYVVGMHRVSFTEQIQTSPDGVTWTLRNSPADGGSVTTVIYAGGRFVAIADVSGTFSVMTSGDGITWTGHTIPSASRPWHNMAYSPTLHMYAAVSDAGTSNAVMTSDDGGVTWTNQTTPVFTGRCIAWGAGIFSALGGDLPSMGGADHVMTSPDGTTWTIQANPGTGESFWNAVVFAASQFVAVGVGEGSELANRAMTSDDGISWTIQDLGVSRIWYAITWGAGRYVAVANDELFDSGTTSVSYSDDGIAWLQGATEAFPNFCRGVCSNAAVLVVNYCDGPGQGSNQAW